MSLKRVVSEEVADQKTYEKLRRELDVLDPGHADRPRLQAEMNSAKSRMAARRGA